VGLPGLTQINGTVPIERRALCQAAPINGKIARVPSSEAGEIDIARGRHGWAVGVISMGADTDPRKTRVTGRLWDFVGRFGPSSERRTGSAELLY
jgi:hypothetical protein